MALAPFTSNDEVRGVLGVTDKELLDVTLDLGIYEINLRYVLGKINAAVIAQFNTINAIAVATRTTTQAAFWAAVKLYSPYVVAFQLAPSLSLMAPKDITDGKAAVGRFSESPFKAVIAAILVDHDKYQDHLTQMYADLVGSVLQATLAPRLFLGVSSGTDRVTNLAR